MRNNRLGAPLSAQEEKLASVDTVPPPASGEDVYSQATAVRDAPPDLLDSIRRAKDLNALRQTPDAEEKNLEIEVEGWPDAEAPEASEVTAVIEEIDPSQLVDAQPPRPPPPPPAPRRTAPPPSSRSAPRSQPASTFRPPSSSRASFVPASPKPEIDPVYSFLNALGDLFHWPPTSRTLVAAMALAAITVTLAVALSWCL